MRESKVDLVDWRDEAIGFLLVPLFVSWRCLMWKYQSSHGLHSFCRVDGVAWPTSQSRLGRM